VPVAGGKRAGARPKKRLRPDLLVLALGMTLAVVGWGYLVVLAISFGGDARAGDSPAWGLLALAAVGAMACLFLALLLGARALRALGITSAPEGGRPTAEPGPPGRRISGAGAPPRSPGRGR